MEKMVKPWEKKPGRMVENQIFRFFSLKNGG
jgi:hypothetical protein